MKYCKRLYELRIDNDLTQKEVAEILNTTKQNYSNYERGTRKLTIDDLETLCRYYKVSADYIIGLTDEQEPNWHKKTKNINIIQNNKINKINID